MSTKLARPDDIDPLAAPPHLLDTLETTGYSATPKPRETLVRRTIQKATTAGNTLRLIDLCSPLQKAYWKTWHCGETMLQEGEKFSTQLCRKKWCRTCAHIRTANLINGYKHLLEDFTDAHLVTLTTKNCKGRQLKDEYRKMVDVFRRANKNIRKTHKMQISGLRTFECSFNEKTGEYNPHFHVIVDTKEGAELLRDYWMKDWQKRRGKAYVNAKAQDVRKVTTVQGLLEVVKYATKMAVKTEQSVKAQDWIYQCTQGKRLAQPFGTLRKAKIENPPTHTDVVCGESRIEIWGYEHQVEHYVNAAGETLVSDAEKAHYIQEKKARKEARQAHKTKQLNKNPQTPTEDDPYKPK